MMTGKHEPLHDAIAKMLKRDWGRLPVVLREDERHVVGYLGRGDILAARLAAPRRRRFAPARADPGVAQGVIEGVPRGARLLIFGLARDAGHRDRVLAILVRHQRGSGIERKLIDAGGELVFGI